MYSDPLVNPEILVLPIIQDSWTSSKVVVFSWKLLEENAPTKDNLFRRMVLVDLEGVFLYGVLEKG